MEFRSLAIAALVLAAPPAFAETPVEMINKLTCVAGSDTRELEIVAKDGGHIVNYTKGGATKEVGTCVTTKEKCQRIFDGIRSNLEAAGYSCKT